MKRPTLKDVALEAGVSAMTVSVVLNGARSATRVSEATRQRIVAAAQTLGYRPNAAARGLQRRRMDTIGVATIVDGGELNLYFLEIFNGILEAAALRNQMVMVASIAGWEADQETVLHLGDGRIDGLILIASELDPAIAGALVERLPFVTVHARWPTPGVWNLEVDNEGGAYQAVRHLISLGHRRILHLTGSAGLPGTEQRKSGYFRALAEAGLPRDESLVRVSGFSNNAGRQAMEAFLAERGDAPLPTAVFCGSDAIGAGCLEVLTAHGLRVPDDLSIVGFDDSLDARMTAPPLTTIRQPFRRLGQRAVELLLERIDESATGTPTTELLPIEMIHRASSAPPKPVD